MSNQSIDDVSKIVSAYFTNVENQMNSKVDAIAQECVEKLKNNPSTPKYQDRRTINNYSKTWMYTQQSTRGKTQAIVYNRDNYRLTHLLEKGHATRNGGFTRKFKHIAPVNKWAKQEMQKAAKEAIEEASK